MLVSQSLMFSEELKNKRTKLNEIIVLIVIASEVIAALCLIRENSFIFSFESLLEIINNPPKRRISENKF